MSSQVEIASVVEKLCLDKLSPDQVISFYEKWAEGGDYDQDMESIQFMGPALSAENLARLYPERRQHVTILDVAAGTGKGGSELHRHGFRNIDALDPCQPMLDEAKRRGVYRNYICDLVTSEPLDIPTGTYDAVLCVGSIAEGHLPADAIYELLRLTKKGGYIILVGNAAMWKNLPEYSVKMAGYIRELELERKMTVLKEEFHDNYRFSTDEACTRGVVILIRKL